MEENKSKQIIKLYAGFAIFVFVIISSIVELYPMWLARNIEPGSNLMHQAIYKKIISICLLSIPLSLFVYARLALSSDIDLKILNFSQKFYSEETVKLCFEPIIADWKTEHSEAISQNLNWKAHWISIRYFYAFIAAMIQQSWIGRLIEFLQRLTK